MGDVLDILDAGRPTGDAPPVAKRGPKPKPPKPAGIQRRKPEGMHRELFALLNTSDSDAPLLPTDFAIQSQTTCYKQVRANLSIKKPRRWLWTPFLNPARKDHLQLYHWRRVTDPNDPPKEYQFAKYNVKIDSHIPKYDEKEYNTFLICDQWTKEETDYLIEMCTKFDLRFIVIHDRWDKKKYPTPRTVEDLKERYYYIYNQLAKARSFMDAPKLKEYDSKHERMRKQQLINLYNRTKEQIEEEENLLNEQKKIDQKKKERERKTQDLQKIMDAAGRSVPENKRTETHQPQVGRPSGSGMRGMPGRRPGRGAGRPSRDSLAAAAAHMAPHIPSTSASLLESNTLTIKFPDFKTSGSSLRSQRLKLPTSLGSKKMKALEQMIQELGLDQFPMPTEGVCQSFNELRGDLLLLYELKINLANTDFEIQAIKNQLAAVGKPELVPDDNTLASTTTTNTTPATTTTSGVNLNQSGDQSETSSRDISDVIDLNAVNTPGRKRKAALEQSNVLRKLKKTL